MRLASFGDTYQVALTEPVIAHLHSERLMEQKVCLDRSYYVWAMELCTPGGEIRFDASGFTQVLRRKAMLCAEQRITGFR